MRVCVTGVAGLIGSHLAEALIARGDDVYGVDSLIGGYQDNIPAGMNWLEADCNDFDAMYTALEGCEVVYHCAALPYEGLSVFSPHLVTQGIVTASTGVFSAAIARKVRRIVFLSSMARYGTNKIPFTEDMPTEPQDPYGIGKVCAEQLLANLCKLHCVEHMICVPHNVIGPRQRYSDPMRNVAAIFIHRMLLGKQPIIYGDGRQVRCFSFVSDVVDPILRLGDLDHYYDGLVVNIGPDRGEISINVLAERIAHILDFKLDPIYLPDRPAEVKLATCSAAKARRLLGYEARVGLDSGLKQMITWVQRRGVGEFEYRLPLEIMNEKTPKTWSERLM
jgi:UDP-glucose 4-epimerase